eukprot:CAMPEP_0181310662 /NCGR_PEP_ID=MMETSP1101-20121128/12709_1 /TAXON_ID=46948 /ORGANISM="Rhodomonas abbreviata, Strain Caron Lab Isolate" /LENGTH=262 /DNA_ID=CAMNT_0023417313 /DNA_START=363 /DNA_END=1148 /DNA_ORIENTATION=+
MSGTRVQDETSGQIETAETGTPASLDVGAVTMSETEIVLDDEDGGRKNDDEDALRKLAIEEGKKIILLCCIGGGLSSLDRQAMSVAIVPMSQELLYRETVKGSVSSIFSLGYTLSLLPLGLGQQLLSPKLLMAGGVLTWSMLTIATPSAAYHGTPFLLAARMGVGAAEAVVVPTVQTFVARWVPRQNRSTALSLLSSCFSIGTITALLVAPRVVDRFGWPAVFVAFGSTGAAWVGAWMLTAKDAPPVPIDPPSKSALSTGEG